MIVRLVKCICLGLVMLALCLNTQASAQASAGSEKNLDVVRYGELGFTADAAVYIAIDEGYFAEQKIKVELTRFDSAAMMVAPLATGQLDVGNGAPSAALYNAIAQGLNLRIVADAGQNTAGAGVVMLFALRKDSPIKSPADLKGKKISLPARAISPETDLRALLRKGGLEMSDIEIVQMSFADAVVALRNSSIDMAMQVEPFGTRIGTSDWGKIWMVDNQINPDHQVAVILYGPKFIETNAELGKRFMTAYVKAARLYADGIFNKNQSARERVIKALINRTPVKDPEVWKQLTFRWISPDGRVNMKSLENDQRHFLETKMQKVAVDINKVVDNQFVDYAVKQLGPVGK